jgi:hypothetical protein
VFLRQDGQDYLVGLNSYQAAFTPIVSGGYGTINGATNVDLVLPWIEAYTGIRPVPEPGAWLLAASSAFAFSMTKTRRHPSS